MRRLHVLFLFIILISMALAHLIIGVFYIISMSHLYHIQSESLILYLFIAVHV